MYDYRSKLIFVDIVRKTKPVSSKNILNVIKFFREIFQSNNVKEAILCKIICHKPSKHKGEWRKMQCYRGTLICSRQKIAPELPRQL